MDFSDSGSYLSIHAALKELEKLAPNHKTFPNVRTQKSLQNVATRQMKQCLVYSKKSLINGANSHL